MIKYKTLIKPHLLLLFLVFLCHSCINSNNTANDLPAADENQNPIPTSESLLPEVKPIILIHPIGENGIVSTKPIQLRGMIISQSQITSLNYSLNQNSSQNILSALNENHIFEISLSDILDGENQITFSTQNAEDLENQIEVYFSYLEDYEDTYDDEYSENEIPESTWEDIANLVNQSYQSLQTFLNVMGFLQAHPDATRDFQEFFTNWDGETESLQIFWDDWANTTLNSTPQTQTSLYNNTPNVWELENLRVSITNLQHLTEELFPVVADSLNNLTLTDDINAFETQKTLSGCEFTWRITVTETDADLNMSYRNIDQIHFLDGNTLHLAFDLNDATLTSDYRFTASPHEDCNLFSQRSRLGTLQSTGLTGRFDFNLTFNSVTKKVELSSIPQLFLEVDEVHNELEPAEGFFERIRDWFVRARLGCLFCSSEEADRELIKYIFDLPDNTENPFLMAFNNSLQSNLEIRDAFQNNFQNLFDVTFDFSGSVDVEDSNWDYTLNMYDFATKATPNVLNSFWQMTIDTNQNQRTCGEYFQIPNFHSQLSETTALGDLTFALSYQNLAISLKGLAHSGAFCFAETLEWDGFEMAQLDFQPYGEIDIQPSQHTNSHLQIDMPFRIKVSWGSEVVDYPSTNTNNFIYGTLNLFVEFDSDCETGLTLSVNDIEIESLNGTLQVYDYTFDVESLKNEISLVFENLDLRDLQNITIAPKLLNLEEINHVVLALEDNFLASENDISFGMTLVPPENCTNQAYHQSNQLIREAPNRSLNF